MSDAAAPAAELALDIKLAADDPFQQRGILGKEFSMRRFDRHLLTWLAAAAFVIMLLMPVLGDFGAAPSGTSGTGSPASAPVADASDAAPNFSFGIDAAQAQAEDAKPAAVDEGEEAESLNVSRWRAAASRFARRATGSVFEGSGAVVGVSKETLQYQ